MRDSPDKRKWDEVQMGRLCLEAIRDLHQPAERFRISHRQYPAGTSFGGAAREGRKYILSGWCVFTIQQQTWELQSGDIADIPSGSFHFRVLGSCDVQIVSVWELPPDF